MQGTPPTPAPRVRSYIATGTYTPRSGPLAGQVFTGTPGTSQAYNAYQRARAQALGFSGYGEERRARAFTRSIFEQEKASVRFGRAGILNAQDRTTIMQNVAQYWKGGKLDLNDPATGKVDRSYGGRLDMYLRGLRRRTGTETWHPGDTPK